MVARSQRKSGLKAKSGGSRSRSPGAAQGGAGRAAGRSSRRTMLLSAVLAAGIVLAAGLTLHIFRDRADEAPPGAPSGARSAMFVGSETCSGCHRAEADLWRGSQHRHAMDHASDKTVLGDFSGTTFDYFGVRSRFFRRDGKFLVETDGPDGKLAIFEVKYTFGVDPLQQYLIEFPDGRLQALSIAWDSRPKEAGGQRWFHLYPNEEISHNDILHWTKLNQNWNFMCAECHSTGVRKNYDAKADRFATTFAEISVGCEACHGQGSRHVDWARKRQSWWPFGRRDDPDKGLIARFDERRNVTWPINPKAGNAVRSTLPATLRKEVETCGLCHARRGQFSEDWQPGKWLSETHFVSPLLRGLFYADGQMRDEVYNYGSFKQSKMFAAGVTCSDCHEPHSAKIRLPGDNVCLQCHAPDKYAVATHHRHEGVNPPLACSSCHMPMRTYMVVDQRHDHSFRIPRPDLSIKYDTPNACNDCHLDKSPAWAASAIEGWHGANRKGFQNFAATLHAAWSGGKDATTMLAELAGDAREPAIARASALTELGSRVANIGLARSALADADPMVRIGALDMLEALPVAQRWPLASPLLSDSVLGVRLRAVSLLAAAPTAQLSARERSRFDSAATEFIAAERLNADRPEARTRLGTFLAQRNRIGEAEAEFEAALRLSKHYAPAYVNLADLYRQTGRDSDAERVLKEAAGIMPGDAGVHYALGLTLVRLKRLEEALGELNRAAELAPDQARYAYVFAVALHSAGRATEAMAVLADNAARHPDHLDTLLALIRFSREAGDASSAFTYAQQLARIAPGDPNVARLVEDLRRESSKPAER
jgi:predicted CXXCH cytochrome family protein